jgi:hypothetical protein
MVLPAKVSPTALGREEAAPRQAAGWLASRGEAGDRFNARLDKLLAEAESRLAEPLLAPKLTTGARSLLTE